MLIQASRLFRRTFFTHVRDAPGFYCYTRTEYPKEEQLLWAEAIVGFSQESTKTTDTLSPKLNSSIGREKFDGSRTSSPNKSTSENRETNTVL
jgi:hypothetical protein